MSGVTREKVLADTLTLLKKVSPKPIDPSAKSDVVKDLGFDSITVLELVAELEDHFDISVPLNQLPQIKTVGQMVDKIVAIASGALVEATP